MHSPLAGLKAYTYWNSSRLPHWARIIMGHNRTLCPHLTMIAPDATDPTVRNPRAASNLLRWQWLHRFGGIWVDTDVVLLRPITWLFDLLGRHDLVLFDESEQLSYPWASNFLMAMRPGSTLGAKLLDTARAVAAARPNDSLAYGPHVLQRYLGDPRVKLLPARLVYPVHWHQKRVWLEPGPMPELGEAMAVHLTHGVPRSHPPQFDQLLCSPSRFSDLLRHIFLWDHDSRPFGMFDDADAIAYREAVYHLKPGAVLVEVGTFCGRSLSYVLPAAVAQGARVYAVDRWEFGPDAPGRAQGRVDVGALFRRAMVQLGFDAWVTPVKAKSAAAASRLECADAVYLDALHDFDSVAADIRCWLPKIRPGGWIMGHDYDLPGVKRAVRQLLGPPDRTTGRTWVKRL